MVYTLLCPLPSLHSGNFQMCCFSSLQPQLIQALIFHFSLCQLSRSPFHSLPDTSLFLHFSLHTHCKVITFNCFPHPNIIYSFFSTIFPVPSSTAQHQSFFKCFHPHYTLPSFALRLLLNMSVLQVHTQ